MGKLGKQATLSKKTSLSFNGVGRVEFPPMKCIYDEEREEDNTTSGGIEISSFTDGSASASMLWRAK